MQKNTTAQWILWAIAMGLFLALTLSGHIGLLGLAITAVAVFWYVIVPEAGSDDNRDVPERKLSNR